RSLSIVGLTIVTAATLAFGFLGTATTLKFMNYMYAIRMFGFSMVMLPVTTAGLNQLPPKLDTHRTAMNNTMRQIEASVGTAIGVTIMATTAERSQQASSVAHSDIHGVYIAFIVITILSFMGIFLSIFVTRTYPPTDEEYDVMEAEKRKQTMEKQSRKKAKKLSKC